VLFLLLLIQRFTLACPPSSSLKNSSHQNTPLAGSVIGKMKAKASG